MRSNQIATYYRPEQVCREANIINNPRASKSPQKPELVIDKIKLLGAGNLLKECTFPAFQREEFLLAHDPEYVDAFFYGRSPLSTSNALPWSKELVHSVQYTNASLYYAQRHSILEPQQICFSPTSGFHHAKPSKGAAFCTFSGQVLSAIKLYKEFGVAGAWIDLDAHFGNSIEDSRYVVENLNDAIPHGCNLNPEGQHQDYLDSLREGLSLLKPRFLSHELTWLAFAHGADSHDADDLESHQLSTSEWFEASKIVYAWVAALDSELGRPVPLTISLFGGYRDDDYDSVVNLHVADLIIAARELISQRWQFDLL